MSRCILVIPAADLSTANTWLRANIWTEETEGDPFDIGLSSDGSAPATHYWLNAWVDDTNYAAIEAEFDDIDRGNGTRHFYDGEENDCWGVLTTESLVGAAPTEE